MMSVGIIVACICIVGSVIATFLVWCDYQKMKKAYEEEIEHLKQEVRACRSLLKKQNTSAGS